ncbi:MAG: bifunctional phosphoribosyl-AMP cyclohydrolase/phosphoribosyl-ATP diphosphatase HisIE [Chloroflexi bacterium]|nr:bifunctional phosphoribosyl-AMP cyclohydrolase/phosphoribosyl-ATP diphosphatase HisIE [Chloroflexota bacterium]
MPPAAPPAPLWGPNGLVPAIAQDAADGRVLMLAWMDAEALAATLETGIVHFHSRARGRLWRKGETSGHELRLLDLALDCDSDALLLQVDPIGPTCHRETRSCFDPADAPAVVYQPGGAHRGADSAPPEPSGEGFAWLETLWSTIAERAAAPPAGSYTASLLDGGVDAVARKVTEEATEVLIAAKDDAAAERAAADRTATRDALAGEAADLVFHALVLIAERQITPKAVLDVLRGRHRSA